MNDETNPKFTFPASQSPLIVSHPYILLKIENLTKSKTLRKSDRKTIMNYFAAFVPPQ